MAGKKKHPMMSQRGRYQYYRGDKFQAVSLPYGRGRVSMYIFLPDEDSSLQAFLSNLNAENWESWMAKFDLREGHIVLPRFKVEYSKNLKNALMALGMGVAFDGRANFSEMGLKNIYVDEVLHKTFVEVNEEGTEAAAVTAILFKSISLNKPEPFSMVVDRPFFCAIRDNQTGTVLFMGVIVEP